MFTKEQIKWLAGRLLIGATVWAGVVLALMFIYGGGL